VAFPSKEFFRSSRTTPARDVIDIEDLILAMASADNGRIEPRG
jgi:hypothetical protein